MTESQLKSEAKKILGGRCTSPDCRWLNDDGTLGCTDERVLEFDHIFGGGGEARKAGKDSVRAICLEIRKTNRAYEKFTPKPFRFRLLCANCHEIRRKVDGQAQGARLHKQAAKVRRSLQIPGAEPRRVKLTNDTL